MALTEFESARVNKIVDAFIDAHRPPPHIRAKLDLAFRLAGQSVEIFEIRPRWRGAPGETMEQAVAKATWVRCRNVWRVYWQRADLKWHAYVPMPEVKRIDDFLGLVAEDAYGCFFG